MRRTLVLLAVTLAVPGSARAQTPYPECNKGLIPASVQNINLCNAAVDALRINHPTAALLIGGGNPVIGQVTAMGDFPRFSLALRVSATEFVTPDLSYDGSSTTVGKEDEIVAPFPSIEAALGVLKGFGPSRIFALDLIGAADAIPVDAFDNVSTAGGTTTVGGAALGFGYGARVAGLRQNGIIPEITGSAVWRSLPRIVVGDLSQGDNYSGDTDLHATNLRLMAGWEVSVLRLGLGYGWDSYTGTAHVEVLDQNGGGAERVAVDLDDSRSLMYANVAVEFGFFMLAGEAGYQSGSSDSYKTTFQGVDPGDSRLFGGAALRFSF